VISDVYTIGTIKKKGNICNDSLKDREGRITGIAGGLLNPASDILQNVYKAP